MTPCCVEPAAALHVPISCVTPPKNISRDENGLKPRREPLVVRDGVNDVLAIKAGATSVAIGGRGVDIAVAAADVVLLGDDLRRLPACIKLGRRCRRTATLNALIGVTWTAAATAVAALGLRGAVWIAVLHNVGTFIVLANARRLRAWPNPASCTGRPPRNGWNRPRAGKGHQRVVRRSSAAAKLRLSAAQTTREQR